MDQHGTNTTPKESPKHPTWNQNEAKGTKNIPEGDQQKQKIFRRGRHWDVNRNSKYSDQNVFLRISIKNCRFGIQNRYSKYKLVNIHKYKNINIYMAMAFLLASKSLITRDPTDKSLLELSCLQKSKNYKIWIIQFIHNTK